MTEKEKRLKKWREIKMKNIEESKEEQKEKTLNGNRKKEKQKKEDRKSEYKGSKGN